MTAEMLRFRLLGMLGILVAGLGAVGLTINPGKAICSQGNEQPIFSVSVPSHGKLVWAAEFDTPLDLTTSKHVGVWRANQSGDPELGYADYAGGSWNINPAQHPQYSPFSIENGILTIAVRRTPGEIVPDVERVMGKGIAPKWSGGMLMTDWRQQAFRYGYFEFRARFPSPGKGMFPAIWLYVANGRAVPEAKSGAEIDLLEILGQASGRPIVTTVHRRNWQNQGDQTSVGAFDCDTRAWHIYGFEWQPDRLNFFRDGKWIGEVTGSDASWFDVDMAILLNFTVNGAYFKRGLATDATTPDRMEMQIDYVRVYALT